MRSSLEPLGSSEERMSGRERGRRNQSKHSVNSIRSDGGQTKGDSQSTTAEEPLLELERKSLELLEDEDDDGHADVGHEELLEEAKEPPSHHRTSGRPQGGFQWRPSSQHRHHHRPEYNVLVELLLDKQPDSDDQLSLRKFRDFMYFDDIEGRLLFVKSSSHRRPTFSSSSAQHSFSSITSEKMATR